MLVIGAGPIGICAAIEAHARGKRAIVVDQGCIVNSLYRYPTFMTFFSTPELLEIGGVPFVTRGHEKPTRLDALEYYRRVVETHRVDVRQYERVLRVEGCEGAFEVETAKRRFGARYVIAAPGFFDVPRMLDVPGESLAKVTHFYHEPHPYSGQELLIVGSGNSAAIAALECHRHGAHVTLALRGDGFHEGVKYWIKPDIENRIAAGDVVAYRNTVVRRIDENSVTLAGREGKNFTIRNDFVLALTGYVPDFGFLRQLGVRIGDDANNTPEHDARTFETNRAGLYLAGVVVGGRDTGSWFIENSRAHVPAIFDAIDEKVADW